MLLQLAGYAVLRFTNTQVIQHRDLVLSQIRQFLDFVGPNTLKGPFMDDLKLSLPERALLLILLSEGAELSNSRSRTNTRPA